MNKRRCKKKKIAKAKISYFFSLPKLNVFLNSRFLHIFLQTIYFSRNPSKEVPMKQRGWQKNKKGGKHRGNIFSYKKYFRFRDERFFNVRRADVYSKWKINFFNIQRANHGFEEVYVSVYIYFEKKR